MKVDYAIMFSFPFIIFIHLHSSFLRTGSWMGERWCNMLIIFLHNINLVRPCWAFDRQNQNAKWARQIEVLAKWNDVCDSVRGYAFHLRKKHTIDYWKMETGWLVDNVEKGSIDISCQLQSQWRILAVQEAKCIWRFLSRSTPGRNKMCTKKELSFYYNGRAVVEKKEWRRIGGNNWWTTFSVRLSNY